VVASSGYAGRMTTASAYGNGAGERALPDTSRMMKFGGQ
jgi:hypothetical protein